MASLTIKNLVKKYGNTEVIHGISAAVENGEFIVIVGPSGCGKSTLLRMVAGLETVNEGEILIDGKRVNDMEPMDRDIAMVFQNYALYPHMSVRQNMAYGLKIAKVPKKEIEQKVTDAARLLQLESYLDRKPRALSGGQRQRVAMGRAIVREPALFLFDEPLSNLDAKLRVQMRVEIKQLQSRLGVTSLYVTHDQVEAMTMADRMLVMNEGVAEQIGTPLEVYERPQTLFAAQFIGSPEMNVFDGEATDNKLVFENGSELYCDSDFNGPVKIGFRPEHVQADATGGLEIQNEFSEPLGATTLLHGRLANTSAAITVSVPGVHDSESLGEITRLTVATNQIHLFSPDTGQRIN